MPIEGCAYLLFNIFSLVVKKAKYSVILFTLISINIEFNSENRLFMHIISKSPGKSEATSSRSKIQPGLWQRSFCTSDIRSCGFKTGQQIRKEKLAQNIICLVKSNLFC